MALISPVTEIIPDVGVIYKWLGMLGNAVLEDCDVGEAIEVAGFGERSIHINGPFNLNNRFMLEFNNDPDNMVWFQVTPVVSMMMATPGRQFAAAYTAIWPMARFFRPKVVSTYAPGSLGVDVVMLCMNKVV